MDWRFAFGLDLPIRPLWRQGERVDTGTTLSRPRVRSLAAGASAMSLVGGSVGVSHTLIAAPLFTAQAIRYAAATLVLYALAKSARVPVVRPRGREWLWLAGIAATGLVLFNVAVVRGVAHAEPAVIAVAVACVPILLGIIGPLLAGQSPRRQILLAAVVVTADAGPARPSRHGGRRASGAVACPDGHPPCPRVARHPSSISRVPPQTGWSGSCAAATPGAGAVGCGEQSAVTSHDALVLPHSQR